MRDRSSAAESLLDLSWPRDRLPEALEALFRRTPSSRTVPGFADPAALPGGPADGFAFWIEANARAAGMRAEPRFTSLENLSEHLPRNGVLVIALAHLDRCLLLRWSSEGPRAGLLVSVFVPPGQWVHRPLTLLDRLDRLDRLGADADERPLARLDRDLGLDPVRAAQVVAVLARAHRASPAPLAGWLLVPAAARFRDRVRQVGVWRQAAAVLGSSVGYLLLFITGWAVVGASLLQGRLQPAWLSAWILVLLTLIGLRAVARLASGRLAVFLGALMRERLLEGILRLELEQVKKQGLGSWFGSVLEVEAMEALARGGGHQAILSSLQLLLATGLLALAVGPAPALALAAVGFGTMALLVLWYWRTLGRWTRARLSLTHELCEKMLGHRTLVAQLTETERHRGEDEALLGYERIGARLHDQLALLQVAVPRGWLLLGLGLLAMLLLPERLVGGEAAVGLGGLLAGYMAFRRLASVTPVLAGAAVAYSRTREIFRAAAREDSPPSAAAAEAIAMPASHTERPTIVGHRVEFRHSERGEPVLSDASFEIRRGDRILIQGASGSGKSTLASLVSGLRTPTTGVLLYRGIDHHSLGLDAWRRQVVLVPQFHDNHLLSASLLFNLLLGRRWPPLPADILAAEEVCRALGLDQVLAKMPAGLAQMVGDSGWQLSHGEQSRVFVARALLQQAEVHILDEALAAIDARTATAVLETILTRAGTLLVVHHD